MSAASTPSEAHSAGVLPMSAPSKAPPAMLVMSGGEGYIDFRIGKYLVSFHIQVIGSHFLFWSNFQKSMNA